MTLALAYFGESNASYKAAIMELGEKEEKASRVKHTLFALHSAGANIGYVFGPGIIFSPQQVHYAILTPSN